MLKLIKFIEDWQINHTPQANTFLFKNIKKNKDFVNILLNNTNFLSENSKIEKRIWHVINNINYIPHCEICNKEVNFIGFSIGYKNVCSRSCASKLKWQKGLMNNSLNKRIETYKKLYSKGGEKYEELKYKREQTNIKKFGTSYAMQNVEFKEKYKQIILENYGVDNIAKSQQSKDKTSKNWHKKTIEEKNIIIEKRKNTNKTTLKNNYGENITSAFQIPYVIKMVKEKNLKNRGVEYNFQSKEIREKGQQTCLKKYGFINAMLNEEVQHKAFINSTKLKKYTLPSGKEIKIQGNLDLAIPDLLKKYLENEIIFEFDCPKIKYNKKSYRPDIFIKKDNLIIEIKSIYTFLIDFNKNIEKMKVCIEQGYNFDLWIYNYQHDLIIYECRNKQIETIFNDFIILNDKINNEIFFQNYNTIYFPLKQLIIQVLPETSIEKNILKKLKHNYSLKNNGNIEILFIFQDILQNKPEIILSRILNKLNYSNKIFARKCEIIEINSNIANKFLNKTHLQGKSNALINLALKYNNEIVSVMTFGKQRLALGSKKNNKNEYELQRFASKLNVSVVGGGSKLLKYFIDNYNPSKIISFADKNWSNGKLYEKLGFIKINETIPNYWYIKDGIRKHRFNYRKDILVKDGFNKDLTEHQIMINRGFSKIYDCGNLKYELQLDK